MSSDSERSSANALAERTSESSWVSDPLDRPLASRPDIAIIGMACRLPGDANSPSKLWDVLVNERSTQCDVPKSRFNVDAFYHPKGDERPGSMHMKGGYFLKDEDIRAFDNSFFGINNLEAKYMDPQQRKLLEVVFECFESAGLSLSEASGSNTGCYVGNFTVDYQIMQLRDPEYLHRYNATGLGTTILGNRISHVFNLKGPSLVLDTACSSSLYCLHMACVALENGECDGAVVAGANLIQSPEQHMGTMKAGVLSKTSTCHPFDISADGYGRADGIGALYVKRLEDAIRDGDPIRSVIRGTAINSNGRTPGITLPSALGQEAVISKAYAKAGLSVDDTGYVELHGTGTAVGDPIEAEATSKAFASGSRAYPLMIGSVKSNLGHSEAASGISSIIKATLALEHGFIPATIGVKTLNPKIKANEWDIQVVTKGIPLPPDCQRVGVNSFGYGGANGHVILESPATISNRTAVQDNCSALGGRKTYLIPLSATTDASLQSRFQDLASGCNLEHVQLADLAYTLGQRRSHFKQRAFVVSDKQGLLEKLSLGATRIATCEESRAPFAFIFTGQGAQWAGMGRGLIAEFPVFRTALAEMDTVLKSLPPGHAPSWTLEDCINEPPETSKINEVTHSQPLCTALQVALVMQLAAWNIRPAIVVGHSSGEIAAAFAAGRLTLEQAIIAAYYRGYVVGQKKDRKGAMIAVGLGEEDANRVIEDAGLKSNICVACSNSPESTTISGDEDSIDELLAILVRTKVFARKLKTGNSAYHSHHMAALGEEYESLLQAQFDKFDSPSSPSEDVVFISSVTAEKRDGSLNAKYWRDNLEKPVRFLDAVSKILRPEPDHDVTSYHLIEIGPHAALQMPIKQIKSSLNIPDGNALYYNALSRGKNSTESLLSLLGNLWLAGHEVAFDQVNNPYKHTSAKGQRLRVVPHLPPYRWDWSDKVLWNECRQSTEFRNRRYKRHELLGSKIVGGSEAELTWRNVLRIDDVKWLADHKLEETAVVPGGAYLAMVVEAISQATHTDLHAGSSAVEFHNVHIMAALALQSGPEDKKEVFTNLRRRQNTNILESESWWDYKISSFADIVTVHSTGSVRLTNAPKTSPNNVVPGIDEAALQPATPRTWYERFSKGGLNYGPEFASLKQIWVPRDRESKVSRCQVSLLPDTQGGADDAGTLEYLIHPITIDALLQASLVATAAGVTRDLKGCVPTRIDKAILMAPLRSPEQDTWFINAKAETYGVNAFEFDATLLNDRHECVAVIEGGRMQNYEVGVLDDTDSSIPREPMLRVIWKPDICNFSPLHPEDLTAYLDGFFQESHSPIRDEGLLKLGGAISLFSHKNPSSRMLQIGGSDELAKFTLQMLDAQKSYKKVGAYSTGSFEGDEELLATPWNLSELEIDETGRHGAVREADRFDLILIPEREMVSDILSSPKLGLLLRHLSEQGIIMTILPANQEKLIAQALRNAGVEILVSPLHDQTGQIVLARAQIPTSDAVQPNKISPEGKVIVVHSSETALGNHLVSTLQSYGFQIQEILFDSIQGKDHPFVNATVISLVESQKPLLASIDDDQMSRVKLITDNAKILLWVTAGDLLSGGSPEFALVSGLARALVLEQPSLRFVTYDLDHPQHDAPRSAENILHTLVTTKAADADSEYIENKGVVHIARFIPDDGSNTLFRRTQGSETIEAPVSEFAPVQLAIAKPGQFDTISFKQIQLSDQLGCDQVQVTVKAVGLNAKDIYVLAGKVDTQSSTCTLEFAGIVDKVGSAVDDLCCGDRVVVMAPSYFKSTEIVPRWACKKLRDDEEFTTMCTLPVVFSTALYALQNRASLQKGESVLIHSGAGGFGIAAIQIAKSIGAEVFTTVSTNDKKQYLIKQFGLKPENILSSSGTSFAEELLSLTAQRGVDVVVNSLTGDQLRASWRCCAPFGRFIEIGKRDLLDSGRLDMHQFLNSVTFSAFDLSSVYHHQDSAFHNLWQSLLSQVVYLFRAGVIQRFDSNRVFGISELPSALRYFSSRNRIGKVTINWEEDHDVATCLKIQPFKYKTTFSSDKYYILTGCLGGLGRSMSRWMVSRGAKKLIFLGRSGTDKASAARLVEDLTQQGAECQVVRGDVCNLADVAKVIDCVGGHIGGVVQAAMGLNESLFTTMSNKYWHTGIDPKVVGTWNLHNAIKGKDSKLDFFLMTSSVSGSVGTATESNYCAGNYFLDMFARYRRAQGLPAVAVGLGMISEVGYLHENPDIEALLLRKGIQPIDEDELLQILDIALSSQTMEIPHTYDTAASAHILTGLEPLGVLKLRKRGFDVSNITMADPRAAILARVLNGDDASGLEEQGQMQHDGKVKLPADLRKSMDQRPGLDMEEAITEYIAHRFGNLVLTPASQITPNKPLAAFGMDSMIAAEFRTWLFQAFKVDVPFLELLSNTQTVALLAATVVASFGQ